MPHTVLRTETDDVTLAYPALPVVSRARSERRRHHRASQPSLPNGLAYSLRAIAVAAPLVGSDLVALFGSVFAASLVVGWILPGAALSTFKLACVLATGLLFTNTASGLYPAIGMHPVEELRRSVLSTSSLVGVFLLAGFLWESDATARSMLFATGMISLVATPVLRSTVRNLFTRFSWWRQPLLVLGSGPAVDRVSAYFRERPSLGLDPFVVGSEHFRNGTDVVARLASEHGAVCAAVHLDGDSRSRTTRLLRECANIFPHLLIVPSVGESVSSYREPTDLGGLPCIRTRKSLLLPGPRSVKRVMDTTLALLAGLVCVPVFLGIGLAIKLTSPGPVLFGHERIGRNRKPFLAWKFRSMHVDSARLLEEYLASDLRHRREWEETQKLKDDPRLTAVGRFLRRTSLDELPQIWNVLRGDMSLVGPRPIVEEEAKKYGPDFARYLSVPPGITGLWQVSGRNRTTYEERILLDAWYVENWSLTLDAYILAKTVRAVVSGEGAY